MEILSKFNKDFNPKEISEYKTKLLTSEVFKAVEEKMHSSPKDLSDFYSILYEAYKGGDLQVQHCLLQFLPLLIRSSLLKEEYFGALLCIYNVEVKTRRETSNEAKVDYLQILEKEKPTTQDLPDYQYLPFLSDLKSDAKILILRVVLQVYQKNIEKLPKESVSAFTKVIYELSSLGMPFEIPPYQANEKLSFDKVKTKPTKDQKIILHSTVLNEFINILKYLLFRDPSKEVYEACYAVYLRSNYEQQEDCLLNVSSLINLIKA